MKHPVATKGQKTAAAKTPLQEDKAILANKTTPPTIREQTLKHVENYTLAVAKGADKVVSEKDFKINTPEGQGFIQTVQPVLSQVQKAAFPAKAEFEVATVVRPLQILPADEGTKKALEESLKRIKKPEKEIK